jgi:hypothetical protein
MIDPKAKSIRDFEEFTENVDGVWKGPDGMTLDAGGGNPGENLERLLVRRWIASEPGTVSLNGSISHSGRPESEANEEQMNEQGEKEQGEEEQSEEQAGEEQEGEVQEPALGDGVVAIVLHNGNRLRRWAAHGSGEETGIDRVDVDAGDTIDWIVQGKKDTQYDNFYWPVSVVVLDKQGNADAEHPMSTDSERDYRSEDRENTPPLGPLARLAQVLWMSNEFLYVD